jgi:hypothetical protein
MPQRSVLPLTILNLSAGMGRILVGYTADRVGVVNSLFVAVLGSGIAQLLVWNVVKTYGGIVSTDSRPELHCILNAPHLDGVRGYLWFL